MSFGKLPLEMNWTNIFENHPDEQNFIAIEIRKQYSIRKLKGWLAFLKLGAGGRGRVYYLIFFF